MKGFPCVPGSTAETPPTGAQLAPAPAPALGPAGSAGFFGSLQQSAKSALASATSSAVKSLEEDASAVAGSVLGEQAASYLGVQAPGPAPAPGYRPLCPPRGSTPLVLNKCMESPPHRGLACGEVVGCLRPRRNLRGYTQKRHQSSSRSPCSKTGASHPSTLA